MTENTTDSHTLLLQATGQGDRQAFEQLYHQLSPYLFAVALRILRQRSWAEEVLHDAMLTIWQRAASYDQQQSSPKTWMSTIVRHRAIDYARLRANQTASLEAVDFDAPDSEALQTLSSTFAEGLSSTSEARRLSECLNSLPGDQKQSLALAYYQGLSHSEVAGHLQQPVGTVKSWIRRALAQLKECVGI